MWKDVLYLRTGRRRPIAEMRWQVGQDPQAALPVWWCQQCGREVYVAGADRCSRCDRKEKKYAEDV